jgi:hypothetical protein
MSTHFSKNRSKISLRNTLSSKSYTESYAKSHLSADPFSLSVTALIFMTCVPIYRISPHPHCSDTILKTSIIAVSSRKMRNTIDAATVRDRSRGVSRGDHGSHQGTNKPITRTSYTIQSYVFFDVFLRLGYRTCPIS